MNKIEIVHNPFVVETGFFINGKRPSESSKLAGYKDLRLQLWVEDIFDEIVKLFNGEKSFEVVFTGVEADYLDLKESAEKAVKNGMSISLSWIESKPAEKRIDQIRQLIDEAKQHDKFASFISENLNTEKELEAAFDKDFDVYVVATMSSGKSTLINAMLGTDLLPAANEATTATIARITDNDSMKGFSAKRYSKHGELLNDKELVTKEDLEVWNRDPETSLIDLEGNIVAIQERSDVRLVITDTPGPNNSQDQEHHRTTMSYIQDSKRNPLILYVLNATQLGTNDDRNLLGLVAEAMHKGGKQSKDRFIFVVNKMDMFDPESGEDVSAAINRVKKYLINNGIDNPVVYPVSAYLTRLLRADRDSLTRKERGDCNTMEEIFLDEPSMNMVQYMPLSAKAHRMLTNKNYTKALVHSGLPAVEVMIDEYINKYNLPHRLKRANDALRHAIKVGMGEVELLQQMKQDELELKKLNEEISVLQKKREKGFDTIAYKDSLEASGKSLPKPVLNELLDVRGMLEQDIHKIVTNFSEQDVSVSRANELIKNAEESLVFLHDKLINKYENLFVESQEAIKAELQNEYNNYVVNIFNDVESLSLPVLEGIKNKALGISLNIDLRDDEIDTKSVVRGKRKVSASRWWNPFSWGRTIEVDNYVNEKFVNLKEVWEARESAVIGQFMLLDEQARQELEHGKNRLIDSFTDFMSSEFDDKFNELLDYILQKTSSAEEREKSLEDARKLKAWIEEFEEKLELTLAV